jgi:hypothetical protein
VVCLMVQKNILRGTLHLYTGGVLIILPQTFGRSNGARKLSRRLKALCKVKEEKKFEARLKELEKILNDDVKSWLLEQLSEKSKWTLTFDEGGSRYGIMTTNISKVFNFILKGIRALPIYGIMYYTFYKCNEYFVNSWEKAR